MWRHLLFVIITFMIDEKNINLSQKQIMTSLVLNCIFFRSFCEYLTIFSEYRVTFTEFGESSTVFKSRQEEKNFLLMSTTITVRRKC